MSTPDEMGLTEEAARGYESFFVPAIFHQWPPFLIDAAQIQADNRVLDAGCGTGVLSRQLHALGATVTGLDLSDSMLSVAREVCPNAAFHQGNVCKLPFEDNQFDAAVSAFMLMFVPEPMEAIAELKRVVRPGGRIAFSVWQSLDSNPVYRHLTDATGQVAGEDAAQAMAWPFAMGDMTNLDNLCSQAELNNVSLVEHDGTAHFPSVEELVNIEINAWLLAGSVSQQQIDQICQRLRGTYADFADASGPIRFPLNAIIASATVD